MVDYIDFNKIVEQIREEYELRTKDWRLECGDLRDRIARAQAYVDALDVKPYEANKRIYQHLKRVLKG